MVHTTHEQLFFRFVPTTSSLLDFFIVHSGVAEAFSTLERILTSSFHRPHDFYQVYVYGPKGSGKTHLLQAVTEHIKRQNAKGSFSDDTECRKNPSFSLERKTLVLPHRVWLEVSNNFQPSSLKNNQEELPDETSWTASYIAQYEALRSSGGVILLTGEHHPKELTINPHAKSRLLSGEMVAVSYPKEEELRPIFSSLQERYQLQLSPYNIQYLLKRIAPHHLSFRDILDTINSLSLSEGRSAKNPVIKDALRKRGVDITS